MLYKRLDKIYSTTKEDVLHNNNNNNNKNIYEVWSFLTKL